MGTEEAHFVIDKTKLSGTVPRVELQISQVLPSRVLKTQLAGLPGLADLQILNQPVGTNFPVSQAEADLINHLINRSSSHSLEVVPDPNLPAVIESFQHLLAESHIYFGTSHLEIVRRFVVSLATKPFVILTGLSGSGKTQLAYKFGQWLGDDRYELIAVRPDWTSPESLLGYEDALLKSVDGRSAWRVPRALQFILKAAADPAIPHLLILDEMNLAHVERYFADVLSGMESGTRILPNLVRDEDGVWRTSVTGPDTIRFPKNLFLVGTVNVDETTYMFSPKVLDRSNTIEFRVKSSDFGENARKPIDCQPGPDTLARGFLQVATDLDWQSTGSIDGVSEFRAELRNLHDVLYFGGFEFGHRVYFEAARFAALLSSAGVTSWKESLDIQILQKILPRLHGSRRKLEPTLIALQRYCQDLSTSGTPLAESIIGSEMLPRSFDKVSRMMRSLYANQFASFAE
jgi:5-methylcytosine-specific restriction protein B